MPLKPVTRHPLTPQQERFIRSLAVTGDISRTAEQLGIAYSTAKGHSANVRTRAGVPHEADAVAYIREKWPKVFVGIKEFAPQPSPLGKRQREAIRLAAQGNSIPAIAEQMGIKYNSAKTHLAKVFKHVGATSQPNAIARIYALWPHVFDGVVAPTPREAPTPFQRTMLARISSGQGVFAAGRAMGFSEDSTRSEMKSLRRTMNCATTEQAVYSAHVHGYIRPRSVIR